MVGDVRVETGAEGEATTGDAMAGDGTAGERLGRRRSIPEAVTSSADALMRRVKPPCPPPCPPCPPCPPPGEKDRGSPSAGDGVSS